MVKLGGEEDLHREFKSAAALKTPDLIARGVVAFLNAEGGSLWVGVAEDGQGRATAFEPIPDADAAKLRLQNVLVDTIEPSPILDADVTLSVKEVQGSRLLLVEVKEGGGSGPPYALLDKGRRGYFKRTGSRIRTMTREELAEGFAGIKTKVPKRAAAERQVAEKLSEWIGSKPAALRMLVRPVEPIPLKLVKLDLYSLLVDAGRTGNRELGWTFASRFSDLQPITPKGWRFGKRDDVQWLELYEATGALELFVKRERLHWRDGPNELWPYALLELPVSILRLAKVLYSGHSAAGSGDVVLGLGVYGIGDCTLRPHSPDSIGYMMPRGDLQPLAKREDRDYFSSTPVCVTRREVDATPDRCAMHLAGQLYRDFGYDEDQLPREYDPKTGRLVFPR